jgi:hypothetical protein
MPKKESATGRTRRQIWLVEIAVVTDIAILPIFQRNFEAKPFSGDGNDIWDG